MKDTVYIFFTGYFKYFWKPEGWNEWMFPKTIVVHVATIHGEL